jgi:aryl-alcohol dehydrogenase-like predicted oxidoreductase
MEYRSLGSSGLKVSEIGLGGNNFGWYADEPTSIAVIHHALDLGVNYIDTADMYDRGTSEAFIGNALKGKRSQVILATKFGYPMGDGPNEKGGSRYYMVNAIENSLRRLKTDYIDLYQIHIPDPTTPIEETLRAFDDLIRSGKVRYIGCSNFAAWQLCEALWTSRACNLPAFVTVQSRYNILEREIEKELVPCCQAYNIGIIPWGPLSGGFLTGKHSKGMKPKLYGKQPKPPALYDPSFLDTNWDKLVKMERFASECGHKLADLALAWLLAKPYVSTVIAGVRTKEQVSANVASSEWKLTAEELNEVESVAKL